MDTRLLLAAFFALGTAGCNSSNDGVERPFDIAQFESSNLPLMIIDPAEIEAFDGAIDTKVKEYTSGVSYEIRSGAGVQQLDNYNGKFVLMLRRLPGGTLDLESEDIRWF